MSSVISLAYFSLFLNLNISRTNVHICKQQTVFLFYHGSVHDTAKISRGKNLIIVPFQIQLSTGMGMGRHTKISTMGGVWIFPGAT